MTIAEQRLKSQSLETTNIGTSGHAAEYHFVALGKVILFMLLSAWAGGLTGCGGGGYPGGGIKSLSASTLKLDAGQSYKVSSTVSGSSTVSWSLTCGSNSCGTLANITGASVIYTAPTGLTAPLQVTLIAGIAGTQSGQSVSITVNAGPTISGTPPAGTVGIPYSTTLTAAGGTGPLTWSVTGGSLPAGLTLNSATGVISGTPTSVGSAVFSVQITDASAVPAIVTASETISITAPRTALTGIRGNPPAGTVGTSYSIALQAVGGTGPYTWSILSGTLPAGLSLSPSTGILAGTPTVQGTSSFNAQVQDATGAKAFAPFSITINAAGNVTITSATLPNGTVGTPYSSTIGVTGGTAPYTCVITSGTLQSGLTLGANCAVTGTPTTAGTVNLMVKATDSGNPTASTTSPVSLTIAPAALAISTGTLPNGTVGTPYSSTIGVAGGTAPYACTLVTGILPAGLSLGSNCLVSGTPTVAGTANLTVKATDFNNPVDTVTGPVSITISAGGANLTLSSPSNGAINTPYSGTIPVSGGTGPYSCTITSGTLQAGLTLGANCLVSGTPTVAGTANLTVKATDSSSPTKTTSGSVALTVNPAGTGIAVASPPIATVGAPYTGTIPVTGGTGPYTCLLAGGTLPAGLSLSNSCVLTGTPTVAGNSTVSIQATDSSNPASTTTAPVSITVQPLPTLTFTGSLTNATLNMPYVQTLAATGGVGPYTYAVTAGTLPTGITVSTAGVVNGTPTVPGASSFTVTATDSEGTPQTAPLPLILLVAYAPTTNSAELTGPYAFLFQGYDDVIAGVLAYKTATVGSFTADGTGVLNSGELDSNHQGSTATGATILSNNLVGTYQINADNRGLLTISTLGADGTVTVTSTYAISVKAPVAPATTTAQGSLIEFDNNQAVGTKGSGTFLAQQPAAFAAGLNGSYAFGVSGDSPCLPTCTVGIIAGPNAAVGQFTTNAGAITGGSDLNIASNTLPNAALNGSYGTADSNGRVQLTMNTANTPAGVYPSDYAVYLVNANQAFLVSTDKHSSYILLAGSAQLQTQASFSNASMNGAFVGYENSQANPAIVGGTVQNTLNLSSATVFRATGSSDGNCNITNVDVAATTGLLNLLAPYKQTGTTTCAVTSNGRGTLVYPEPSPLGVPLMVAPAPRVFYLSSPNNGYFLETSYAAVGQFEAQTGSPFSEANTFTGTYVYSSIPDSTLANTDSSGFIQSHGDGTATSTQDENVGVGTINVLDLGVTTNGTYTAPDPVTGRFTYNGTIVIYSITPNRFVLLDTNVVTTSSTISLLY